MKAYVLYHPNSEHARVIEEYIHDYGHTRGKKIEPVSLETREGSAMARLYDIVEYPAVLVTKDDKQLIKHWTGVPLPLMQEVDGYNT
jgi:hypothetical protein